VAGGAERLITAAADSPSAPRSLLWGTFLMAPWVGRLDRGRLVWEGEEHRFPANLGDHAIHGLVFDAELTVDAHDESSVAMSCPLAERGWPFGGVLRSRVTLGERSLALAVDIEAKDSSMPVSAGWHPYFARPREGDLCVAVDSDHVLELSDDLIPTGRTVAVDAETDLRQGPVLGDRRLDHVYAAAATPATVTWPDLELTVSFEQPLSTLVVYTPAHAVCVEPQSAWPDAPALAASGVRDSGLVALGPGETFTATTTWTW